MAQSQKGRDAARRNEVVSTRVPDPRERIVFRVEVDQATLGAADTFEGGIYPVRMPRHGEALLLEKIADRIVGLVFFVGKLGV